MPAEDMKRNSELQFSQNKNHLMADGILKSYTLLTIQWRNTRVYERLRNQKSRQRFITVEALSRWLSQVSVHDIGNVMCQEMERAQVLQTKT
jgi:hypothetical protein